MTRRGSSTVTAVLLLASLPLMLYLAFLASPAASSEREVATLVQGACPAESVPALVQGRPRCLTIVQTCKRTLDPTFHRYAFHCHNGSLIRPASFAMRVNVGGHRLAISCRGRGRPTVISRVARARPPSPGSFSRPKSQRRRASAPTIARASGTASLADPRHCAGRESRRGSARPLGRSGHRPALRPRRLVTGRLLQSAVCEAIPRRGGRPRRSGRHTVRYSG